MTFPHSFYPFFVCGAFYMLWDVTSLLFLSSVINMAKLHKILKSRLCNCFKTSKVLKLNYSLAQ